jgi:hypothetical protein
LTTESEGETSSVHPRIRVSRPPVPWLWRVDSLLRILRRHVGQEDGLGTLRTLKSAVVDFEPSAQAWAGARTGRLTSDGRDECEVGVKTA